MWQAALPGMTSSILPNHLTLCGPPVGHVFTDNDQFHHLVAERYNKDKLLLFPTPSWALCEIKIKIYQHVISHQFQKKIYTEMFHTTCTSVLLSISTTNLVIWPERAASTHWLLFSVNMQQKQTVSTKLQHATKKTHLHKSTNEC